MNLSWWIGDPKNSKESDFKKKQIQQIIEHQRFKGSVFLFVHFHSITNLSKQQIDEVFRNEYFIGRNPLIKTNQQNGLYVQNFNSKQTLEETFRNFVLTHSKTLIVSNIPLEEGLSERWVFWIWRIVETDKGLSEGSEEKLRGLFRSVEHQRSVEFCLYKRIFPSTHPIWIVGHPFVISVEELNS